MKSLLLLTLVTGLARVASPATYNIYRWIHARRSDPSYSTGGFDPMLAIFESNGSLVGLGSDGPCPPRSVDSVTNFCLDDTWQGNLAPGSYLVALTQYFNSALGDLPLGFAMQGSGNFTGGPFLDAGTQRTGSWSVTVDGVDAASVPEPAASLSVLTAIAVFAVVRRKANFTGRKNR